MAQVTSSISSPTSTVRVNITKNTKGYQFETSVTFTSTEETPEQIDAELTDLLRVADTVARREIATREQLDAQVPADLLAGADDDNEKPF